VDHFQVDLEERGILKPYLAWLNLFSANGPVWQYIQDGKMPATSRITNETIPEGFADIYYFLEQALDVMNEKECPVCNANDKNRTKALLPHEVPADCKEEEYLNETTLCCGSFYSDACFTYEQIQAAYNYLYASDCEIFSNFYINDCLGEVDCFKTKLKAYLMTWPISQSYMTAFDLLSTNTFVAEQFIQYCMDYEGALTQIDKDIWMQGLGYEA
jgi:hypothetical protein